MKAQAQNVMTMKLKLEELENMINSQKTAMTNINMSNISSYNKK